MTDDEVDGCDLVAIVVHPSSSPPVRHDGRIWVRVGPTTRVATPEEERRLSERRRAANLPFDVHPVAGAQLGDLDLERFRRDYLPNAVAPEVLEENHRDLIQQLAALRLVTPDGEPTVVGVLTLADDPLRFIPGAYVQFIRFDGTDLSDPIIAQQSVAGPLQELLRRLDDLIATNIRAQMEVAGKTTHAAHPWPGCTRTRAIRSSRSTSIPRPTSPRPWSTRNAWRSCGRPAKPSRSTARSLR